MTHPKIQVRRKSLWRSKNMRMKPVILISKGCLSDRAKKELRSAGYSVVQANDITQVKPFYPDNFTVASNRAKIKAFEYFCGGGGPWNITPSDLREKYVAQLKEQKVF